MSSDAATSNAFDSLTLTSAEAASRLQGCVSWGYRPFPLLADRAGFVHLTQSFCVTWGKIIRVELYQSPAGVGEVGFPPVTVTDSSLPTPAGHAEDFGSALTVRSRAGSSPRSPNFQHADAAEKPPGSSVCFLVPTSMALRGKASAIHGVTLEKKKKGHLSLLLTPLEEAIQAASAELFWLHDVHLPQGV